MVRVVNNLEGAAFEIWAIGFVPSKSLRRTRFLFDNVENRHAIDVSCRWTHVKRCWWGSRRATWWLYGWSWCDCRRGSWWRSDCGRGGRHNYQYTWHGDAFYERQNMKFFKSYPQQKSDCDTCDKDDDTTAWYCRYGRWRVRRLCVWLGYIRFWCRLFRRSRLGLGSIRFHVCSIAVISLTFQ